MNIPKFSYPKVNFWNNNAPPLQLINEPDCRIWQFREKIGLTDSAFNATSDRNEVACRQRQVRMLEAHPKLRTLIKAWKDHPIPTRDGQGFVNYYHLASENPFWAQVEGLCSAVEHAEYAEQGSVSPEMVTFVSSLRTAKSALLPVEEEFSREILDELRRASEFSGSITVLFDYNADSKLKITDQNIVGYRRYSFSESGMWRFARWLAKKIKKPSWLSELADDFFDYMQYRRHAPLVERSISKNVLDNLLEVIAVHPLVLPVKSLGGTAQVVFEVKFDESGLKARVIDIRPGQNVDESNIWRPRDMRGFKPDESYELSRVAHELGLRNMRLQWYNQVGRRLHEQMEKAGPEFFSRAGVSIPLWETVEKEYRWHTLGFLVNTKYGDAYRKLAAARDYAQEAIAKLKWVIGIEETKAAKAKEWGVSLSIPEQLLDGAHSVSCAKLFPVHLIGETRGEDQVVAKDVVPVEGLPELNGRMVSVTGGNAEGKTTLEEALIHELWLAHTGTTNFSQGMRFNVKQALGAVFIERGAGSTAELLVRKSGVILRELQGLPPESVLLVLDEVGTGSNPSDGLYFGRKMLHKLREHGCSVVFATQLPELADYAATHLDAISVKMEKRGELTPGIGNSNLNQLLEKSGVAGLLN